MAASTSLISVEEYLRMHTDPDCEYVDGVIEERAAGELDHAGWQKVLVEWFSRHEREWGIRVYPELRVRVSASRFRVPDFAVLSRSAPREQVVTHPPLAVFEILSPENTMTRMLAKLVDYEQMGIGAIWVIEPGKPTYFHFTEGKLIPESVFRLPGTSFRVPLEEIAQLID
ncbi:MAG: Uma2 family endonuclease [Acidobacteriota bacterium]